MTLIRITTLQCWLQNHLHKEQLKYKNNHGEPGMSERKIKIKISFEKKIIENNDDIIKFLNKLYNYVLCL